MSNVIEFKKRPEASAKRASSADLREERYKAAGYNLAELLGYETTETGYIDETFESYEATPEAHAKLLAYFDAFGFDYVIYQNRYSTHPQPFVLWYTLATGLAGDVRMCLQYRETWSILRNGRCADYATYVEAVARQDREAIARHRHIAESLFKVAMAERDPEGQLLVKPPSAVVRQDAAEATMLERGMKNLAWTGALRFRFPAFERTGSGEYAIADEQQQALFVQFAYACGWSYVDISRDKMRLEEVAKLCLGSIGYRLVQMHYTVGRRWDKAYAVKAFAGCSDKLLKYISACHGRRVESAGKLRDAVWPELQEWARREPVDLSAFGRKHGIHHV